MAEKDGAQEQAEKYKGPANRPFVFQFCSLSDWPTYVGKLLRFAPGVNAFCPVLALTGHERNHVLPRGAAKDREEVIVRAEGLLGAKIRAGTIKAGTLGLKMYVWPAQDI